MIIFPKLEYLTFFVLCHLLFFIVCFLPCCRSHRMKLPQSVGQKKTKAVEQMLTAIGLETTPMPTEQVAREFNVLRSDMARQK